MWVVRVPDKVLSSWSKDTECKYLGIVAGTGKHRVELVTVEDALVLSYRSDAESFMDFVDDLNIFKFTNKFYATELPKATIITEE